MIAAINSAEFFGAATWPDIAAFVAGALLVLGGALAVVLLRNPVHAALNLIVTLFGIAVLFVAQGAHFLAAVQVIVYAGAIVVMFLFVIMLLGVDRVEAHSRERLKVQRPLAIVFAAAILGLVIAIAGLTFGATGARSQGGSLAGSGSDIEKLANSIFSTYLLPFELTSLLLVIAVVGAVWFSRKPGSEELPGHVLSSEEISDDVSAASASTDSEGEVTK